MMRSAVSSTFRCCMTVQRSRSGKAAQRSPVVSGWSFRRSRMRRRRGAARALKIRSSVGAVDMLYFYNIMKPNTRKDVQNDRDDKSKRTDRQAGERGVRGGGRSRQAIEVLRDRAGDQGASGRRLNRDVGF